MMIIILLMLSVLFFGIVVWCAIDTHRTVKRAQAATRRTREAE